ncbi:MULTISPECIES: GAF domain-containing protein [unclassified Coleofasciculus]|uniref:GAF domain-containing protein n=1 Tax=unclassified Coleofasciculus TaxID=2692782 RepID=UPI00187EBC82|nr:MULTISPECIES: GAF domain-containing protein [unclassified Coleofasciculus]MBE9129066.1 GAF domain-containing protein [Coleofasciculus sp. LEGE 07081]MBE9151935.1 GAF domain-containing protein [Coleofasciculus sp. LEGE 07092]
MNSYPVQGSSTTNPNSHQTQPLDHDGDAGLRDIANRLAKRLERDILVQKTTDYLRDLLNVDRVVLYYFYYEWKGQVTFESLSSPHYSIFGSTGADNCFVDSYAALYQAGRVRAIADIEREPLNPCHRDFLRSIQVRANLVVPILNSRRLWGLLVAHHCQNARSWQSSEIETMQTAATTLATTPAIQES